MFDRHSGVDLADAVAASCASGLPYRIGDNRNIDGGYRRNENADLAARSERVLVLSPFGGRTLQPLDWGMQLTAQVDELRARGSRVETIFPDSNSGHMYPLSSGSVVADVAAPWCASPSLTGRRRHWPGAGRGSREVGNASGRGPRR